MKSVEVKQRDNLANDADGVIEVFGTSDVKRLKPTHMQIRQTSDGPASGTWLEGYQLV